MEKLFYQEKSLEDTYYELGKKLENMKELGKNLPYSTIDYKKLIALYENNHFGIFFILIC